MDGKSPGFATIRKGGDASHVGTLRSRIGPTAVAGAITVSGHNPEAGRR